MAPPAAWAQELEAFGSGVVDLFESRPFWLVTETDVRSKFIEAVLKTRSKVQVDDVCTEATLGRVPRIDLVVKDRDRQPGTLAIEFKRWQIVAKPNRNCTSTPASLGGQWSAICTDVGKLGRLKASPTLAPLIVVYTQHALDESQAATYRARKGLSLRDRIVSGEAFRDALNRSSDGNVKIEDWLISETFKCHAGTSFSLGVFRILKNSRNRTRRV